MSPQALPEGASATPAEAARGAADGTDPLVMVEAWKASGPSTPDPVVLAVVESLARRAAAMPDEAVRQWLVQRMQARMASPGLQPALPAASTGTVPRPGLTALGDLIDRLGRTPTQAPAAPSPPAGRHAAPAAARGRPAAPAPVALKAVTAFQGTWSRLRAEQRLRQALAQVPAMAGPLNSLQVVHRALQAMQALSPAYLDAFLAHVDGLIALEQAAGTSEPVPRGAPPAEPRRRGGATARRKA